MTLVSPGIVCFDLGGVVHRICRSWDEACARAQVPVRDPLRFGAERLGRQRKALVDQYQTGQLACGAFWSAIADATDGLYSPQEIERVHRSWLIEDYPGVRDLIRTLNTLSGVRTACLSNTNHSHWETLRGVCSEGTPGSPAVAEIREPLVSHKMGAAKPNPGIYTMAERSLGAKGSQIVFFDDLEENIAAALARGWQARLIDHETDTAAQMIGHLRELDIAI